MQTYTAYLLRLTAQITQITANSVKVQININMFLQHEEGPDKVQIQHRYIT